MIRWSGSRALIMFLRLFHVIVPLSIKALFPSRKNLSLVKFLWFLPFVGAVCMCFTRAPFNSYYFSLSHWNKVGLKSTASRVTLSYLAVHSVVCLSSLTHWQIFLLTDYILIKWRMIIAVTYAIFAVAKERLKKIQACARFEPLTSTIPVQRSTD